MKKIIPLLLVIMFFSVLIFVFTFPLLTKVNSLIPGFCGSDESFDALWYNWRIKYSFSRQLPLGHSDLIAYPFGVNFYSSGIISYLWLAWTHLLSFVFSPVLTYNLQVFLNILLCALSTYLLCCYIIKDKNAALFSSLAFAFCPYQFARAWQHLSLTYNQWIPLLLFSLILLKKEPSRKKAVILLISLILLLSFDYSIAYMGIIAFLSFSIYVLFYNWREKFFKNKQQLNVDLKYLGTVAALLAIAFVILMFQFLPVIKNIINLSTTTVVSAHNPFHRSFEDLFDQSARPLSYLLPATSHPLFGKFTEQFIGSFLYGISLTEHTLYLGWVPLILAFLAFKQWKKNNGLRAAGFYINFFIFLAVVAWLFSQPPWWSFGNFKIYMPSFFMYKILPMFRAYCRFGIVVMLAIAVLAGFGLKFLLERLKSKGSRFLVTSLLCGLVLFEFWNYPPLKVIDVSRVPTVYYWLKQEPPETVIAEYPLDADSPNEMYKFFQTVHEKKMINGTIPFTYANKVAKIITKLSSSQTTGILSWMGVKYVLVHHDGYAQTGLAEDREEMGLITDNENLVFIRRFPQQDCPRADIMCVRKTGIIDVYEVAANPVEPEVLLDD